MDKPEGMKAVILKSLVDAKRERVPVNAIDDSAAKLIADDIFWALVKAGWALPKYS